MADKIIRAQVVTAVRGLLSDDAFDAGLITQAANWSQDELCNNHRLRFMEASNTLTGALNATTLAFPEDMQTLISFYLTNPQVYDLMKNYIAYGDFMKNHANFATASSGQARTWTDFGNEARFTAPLNAAHTFAVDYLRIPEHVTNDSDEFEIKTNYEELLAKMTLARLMEQNEDYEEAAEERKNMKPLMDTFVRNEGRGQIKTGPTVIRTNRLGGRQAGGYSQADF